MPFCLKQLSIQSTGPGPGPYLHIQVWEAEQGSKYIFPSVTGGQQVKMLYTLHTQVLAAEWNLQADRAGHVGELHRESACQICLKW